MKRVFTASLLTLAISAAHAQQGDGTRASATANVFKPAKV